MFFNPYVKTIPKIRFPILENIPIPNLMYFFHKIA